MTAKPPPASFAETLRIYQDGHFALALVHLQALLAQQPDGAAHWFALLGNIQFKLGNKEEAGDAFIREAALSPERASAFIKLALTLYGQCGARQKIHAMATSALPHIAGDPATVFVVADVCQALGDFTSIRPMLPHLDPRNPQHVAIKCRYYQSIGDDEGLWKALSDGVRDCPGDGYLLITRYAQARSSLNFDVMREYETIMQYPDTPLAQALLSGEMALQRLFWARSEAVIALPSYDSNLLAVQTDALAPLRHPRRALSPSGGRLKIGYLSDDFRQHAVMSVFSEVLTHHDPATVDLTLFCHTPENALGWQDRWPEHLKKAVVRIEGKPTVEVLDMIRHRGIDILVDLKGHTAGARLDILNLADTPLKVSYLGYPATVTGAELDYAITDAYITPESSRPFYVERLCLLPHTSMPNPSLESCTPQPAKRSDWGLPDDAFVFCSFNAVFKISPQTLTLWAKALEGAPNALLWVRCDGGLQRRNLLKGLSALGIAHDRVRFAEPTKSYQDHINRVALADVSLDTTPYNGHATTTDMLRAGVPVVALRGTTSPARMSDGLLHAVGLPDLVAQDDDAFVSIATTLAKEPDLYRAVRQRLAQNRLTSPLFNPSLFARHLEKAFTMMADRVRAGQSPDHITVPALDDIQPLATGVAAE